MSNSTRRQPRVLAIGVGAAGIHVAYFLTRAHVAVHQVTADHFNETTHTIAAGLYEPVGNDPVSNIGVPASVILLDPADATRRGIKFAREHHRWSAAVERHTILLGRTSRDINVAWAAAVDGFRQCEPPRGDHGYDYAATYRTVVVQSDIVRRAILTSLRNSELWTYQRARCGDIDEVLRIARTQNVDAVVIAAGNFAGLFHEQEVAEPAIGIVAKVRHQRPIPGDRKVLIASTAEIFPYAISGVDLETLGGTFLEGFTPEELRDLRVEDFSDEQAQIIERLATLGVTVPDGARWMLGGRPTHPYGAHIRVDMDHDIPVFHVGGLGGSGATFGPAIGQMTTELVLQVLARERQVT